MKSSDITSTGTGPLKWNRNQSPVAQRWSNHLHFDSGAVVSVESPHSSGSSSGSVWARRRRCRRGFSLLEISTWAGSVSAGAWCSRLRADWRWWCWCSRLIEGNWVNWIASDLAKVESQKWFSPRIAWNSCRSPLLLIKLDWNLRNKSINRARDNYCAHFKLEFKNEIHGFLPTHWWCGRNCRGGQWNLLNFVSFWNFDR